MWNRFKTLDPWLYAIPVILIAISLVMIYTLTITSSGPSLAVHQAIFSVLGLLLMVGFTFIDYRTFKGWSVWLYFFGLLSLIAVKVIGKSDFGAQRWINIGPFQYQPGEFEKLLIVVTMASWLSYVRNALSGRRFWISVAALLVPAAAVILQPDLGTAIVSVCAGLGVVLYSHLQRWQVMAIGLGILAVVLSVALSFHNVKPFNKILKDYQRDRLASFVQPNRDASGSGYNVVQSVIAIGSGGVTGEGLGGSQSRLNFLPVAHADFIFAGIAEAWGLVGSWGVIGLYGILLWRLMQAAIIAKDEFGMLVCVGITIKIMVEVLVNVGMNMRLMPVTGIPLPFLSYGGTALLTNTLAMGIVQSIVIRYKKLTF